MKDKNGVEIRGGSWVYCKESDSTFVVFELGKKLRINNLPIEVYRQEDGKLLDFEIYTIPTINERTQYPWQPSTDPNISPMRTPTMQELMCLPECCRYCSNNIYNNPNGNGVCNCALPALTNPIRC